MVSTGVTALTAAKSCFAKRGRDKFAMIGSFKAKIWGVRHIHAFSVIPKRIYSFVMNLQDIQAFVAVAETGSVSRAAVQLRLTQPAITRRIQSFEAAIGDTPLFNRSVKPAVLTTLGQSVLEHCRRVLAAVAELEACSTSAANPMGDLKAGVAHGLGEMVLTTPLDALRRQFPRIRLQISSNWSASLVDEIKGGALDFAVGLLTSAHIVPAGLMRIPLGEEQVVIVSSSRPATRRDGSAWRLRDLSDEGWFLNPAGCGCRAALLGSFDRLQLPMHIAAEVFGEDLQLSLLTHGGGLGLVPRRQFEQSPHRDTLQILDVMDFTLSAMVTLIRRSAPGRFDLAIDVLVRELKTKLGATPNLT